MYTWGQNMHIYAVSLKVSAMKNVKQEKQENEWPDLYMYESINEK